MPLSKQYQFIFLGAGCATLSLVMRMIKSGKFGRSQILLIDKAPKTQNDRTWCFWEKDPGFFEPIVYRRWDKLSFFSKDYTAVMDIDPYEYKMIRAIDFYQYCFEEIAKHPNITILYGDLSDWQHIDEEETYLRLTIDGKQQKIPGAPYVFNSIYKPAPPARRSVRLLQHFKGWLIRTPNKCFDPGQATFMDFRVSQHHGTSFVYVLPFSETTALVEYTLFTKELLREDEYEAALKNYLSQFLQITHYTIEEAEFGVIPMTNDRFSSGGDAWQIGTAGGQTKASSGYTFQFIQKHSAQILQHLLEHKSLVEIPPTPARFRFYDNTLLHILYHNQFPGSEIFAQLFKKNKPSQVLKFLDNESSLADELKIISSLPALPFLKAAIRQLF